MLLILSPGRERPQAKAAASRMVQLTEGLAALEDLVVSFRENV
jgi:hypothetical protein